MNIFLHNGTLMKVSDAEIPENGVLEIPTEINSVKVKGLAASLFSNNEKIRKVIIPETVKEIDDNCFTMSKVEEIIIKGDIKRIGYTAFGHTPNLKSVVFDFPCTSVSFDDFCFSKSGIKSIDLTNTNATTISSGMFLDSKIEKVILPETIKRIDDSAFENCTLLYSINLNDLKELQMINFQAFYNADLSDYCLDLSNECKIERYAFANSHIKSIDIMPYNESEYRNSFTNCNDLISVRFKSTKKPYKIGHQMFLKCENLSKVEISDGCKNILESAFAKYNLSSIKIPESVQIIKHNAFDENPLNENSIFVSPFLSAKIHKFAFPDLIAYDIAKTRPFIEIIKE